LTHSDAWSQYEARKAAWLAQNQNATPEQIERALQKIAEGLGI